MLFGITSHAVSEFFAYKFYFFSVYKFSVVIVVNLNFQVSGMFMSAFSGAETLILFGFIASQKQKIGYSQKLKVYKQIFSLFFRKSAAQHVWHNRYAVFVLYCCGNGNCSGAAAQAFNLIQTVSRIAEIHFAVVGCYIYVFRIEFSQQFYGVVYGVESLTFQRRKHLKRKRCGFVVF